jgi:hypothetical protein
VLLLQQQPKLLPPLKVRLKPQPRQKKKRKKRKKGAALPALEISSAEHNTKY